MPRGDGTGPAGFGPMTGRAAGYCAGYATPGFMNPYGGRPRFGGPYGGYGLGLARRRGWGAGAPPRYGRAYYGYPQPPYPYGPPPAYAPEYSQEQEKDYLEEQAKQLQEELNAVEKRLNELESEFSSGE